MEELTHVNENGDDKCDICGRKMEAAQEKPSENKGSALLWILLGVGILILTGGVVVLILILKRKKASGAGEAEPLPETETEKEQ